MLDKTFRPAEVEARHYALWEASGAFDCHPDSNAEPFCIMMPPPNVTGSLHMGHALNHTLQDVLARFERMRGRDVLWQPGTDHAGIATQMVVERSLTAEGGSRTALGRAGFVERVWAWKAESGSTITRQLRRLGASADWRRERFTMDEGLSAAVRKVFVRLHKDGVIYRDKRLVNWDPKLQTAISDLEVEQREIKGHLWHIAYPVEGLEGASIVVATTRPETMLGDTAVAVHPDDERYRALVGRHAILPLVGRRIPIVADPYAWLYDLYGVETSEEKVDATIAHPETAGFIENAAMAGFPLTHEEGANVHRIPADFVIGPDLILRRVHYAKLITDHLPLAEIEIAAGLVPAAVSA